MNEALPTATIGLVGGLGPAATIHYYQEITKQAAQVRQPLALFIAHADVSRVFGYVSRGDIAGLADYLAGFIRSLAQAGAELAAISAVMPHICMASLREIVPVPLCDVVNTTLEALNERQWSRVTLFGTRAVLEGAMFGRLHGIEVIPPLPEETEAIHNAYVSIVERGEASEEVRDLLTRLGARIQAREHLDAIVMAGTDLALVFSEDTAPFPILDCAFHHVQAILLAARSSN